MSKIHARFYVAEITRYANGESRPGFADPAPIGKVVLRPVTRGEENVDWASSTPSGQIEMTVRGSAFPVYEQNIGKTFHITMEPVTD